MRQHRGIHPRIGALDVLPFYYYGEAARRPERRVLRELRHGEYEGLAVRLGVDDGRPDDGPARFDARRGAILVGARDVLIAYNVWLASDDLVAARAMAREVRASGRPSPCTACRWPAAGVCRSR